MSPVCLYQVECAFADEHMQLFLSKDSENRAMNFMFFGQDRFHSVKKGDRGTLKAFYDGRSVFYSFARLLQIV